VPVVIGTSAPNPKGVVVLAIGAGRIFVLGWRMGKKREPVEDLLDALVWMRRKAKTHEAVDDLIDALVKMRRAAKKKLAKPKRKSKKRKSKKRRVAKD
jgi:hypothetical protein